MSLATLLSNLPPTTVTVNVSDLQAIGSLVQEVNQKLWDLRTDAMLNPPNSNPSEMLTDIADRLNSIIHTVKVGLMEETLEEDALAGFTAPECQ